MSDIAFASLIIAIPLVGIMFAIDRLCNILSGGKVIIKNRIDITVNHPKDVTVTSQTKAKESIKGATP